MYRLGIFFIIAGLAIFTGIAHAETHTLQATETPTPTATSTATPTPTATATPPPLQPGEVQTLPLSSYVELFQPLGDGEAGAQGEGGPQFELPIIDMFFDIAPIAATTADLVLNPDNELNPVTIYFGFRVGLLAITFIISHVMKSIGRPIDKQVIVSVLQQRRYRRRR